MAETPYQRLEREMVHRGNGRPMATRKIGHNTYANRVDDQTIAVRFHATDVVLAHDDGTVTLDTGGWFTYTTKDRMNQWSGRAQIWSDRGVWHVGGYDYDSDTYERTDIYRHRYFDRMRFDPADGRLVNPEDQPDHERIDHANKTTTRAIRAYVKSLTPEVLADLRERGSRGDCLYCRMVTVDTKQPLGDATNNHEHLRDHLDESYYMVSLIGNAYADRGYVDPMLIAASDVDGAINGRHYATRNLRQTVGKYLRKRLLESVAVH